MLKGIDVSTWQQHIDWDKVADDGINFAMIKATQGHGESKITANYRAFVDSKFKENIANAHEAGIACGVYHYFTATTEEEAIYEAEFFLKAIEPYKNKIRLWAAADVESEMWLSKVMPPELTKTVKTFMDKVSETGYKPMLYTNPNYLTYRFTPGAFSDTDIWMAHWGVAEPMKMPKLQIWQPRAGKVKGISRDVDIDVGYFNIDDFTDNEYKIGDRYTIKKDDVYTNGVKVPPRLIGHSFKITQVGRNRIYLGDLYSWVKV